MLRCLPVYAIAVALSAPAAWGQAPVGPAKTPATRPAEPESVRAARQAIAKAVADVSADLGSADYNRRQAAQDVLAGLSEQVFTELLAHTRLDDAEQLGRVGKLFSRLAVAARTGEMLLTLDPKERAGLLATAEDQPGQFNELFSDDPAAAGDAAKALTSNSKGGAETVVLWAIRHPAREVRMAGVGSVSRLGKPSAKVNDELLKHLESLRARQGRMMGGWGGDGEEEWSRQMLEQEEAKATGTALATLKDQRLLPLLLPSVLNNSGGGPFNNMDEAASLVLKLDDKRTVVTLMDHIGGISGDRVLMQRGWGGDPVTIKVGDMAILLILRQTGQSPWDYGFYRPKEMFAGPDGECTGFEDDTKRAAARKKLQQWWEDHKKEYEGVEKVPMEGAGPRRQPQVPGLPGFIRGLIR